MNSYEFCTWLSGFFDGRSVPEDSNLGRVKAKLELVKGFGPKEEKTDDGSDLPVVQRKEIVTRRGA